MQSYKEALQLFQKNSMNLPMTEHEEKLNIMLEYLQHELNKDKKELQILRQDLIHENYIQSDINDETSTSFVQEMAEFTKHFRKLAEEAQHETNDMFKQVENMKNDKSKIKKSAHLLEHRVGEMERVLGVGLNNNEASLSNI